MLSVDEANLLIRDQLFQGSTYHLSMNLNKVYHTILNSLLLEYILN